MGIHGIWTVAKLGNRSATKLTGKYSRLAPSILTPKSTMTPVSYTLLIVWYTNAKFQILYYLKVFTNLEQHISDIYVNFL